jgi:UDP-glucose 4-epimerase
MKILVTGGAGFIGSHTVLELANAGFEPILVDNFANSDRNVLTNLRIIAGRDFTFYEGDCNSVAFLNQIFTEHPDIEGVIHFAADKAVGESVQHPLKYYRNNVGSLVSLLDVMLEKGVKNLVFSSSCTVYGQPEILPVTEETPIVKAESPYGNTKQICEEVLVDTVKSGVNLKAIALRYFNPIGAHPSALIGELPLGVPNNLIPYVTQTAAGIRPLLRVFGNDYNTPDGTCIRDFIHVVDLAKAHVAALKLLAKTTENNHFDKFNIGTGNGNSVKEVVDTFIAVTGENLPYEFAPRRSGDVEQIYANVDKATHVLGWKAEIGLAQSLADAWRWQQQLPTA